MIRIFIGSSSEEKTAVEHLARVLERVHDAPERVPPAPPRSGRRRSAPLSS